MSGGLRYFGAAVGFGFAAVWIMASLAAALVCLMSAVVGYGAVCVAERIRATRDGRAKGRGSSAPSLALTRRTQDTEDIPQWADALNSDLGHIYDPATTMSPLAREVEYGWPIDDETVVTSGTLH